MRQNSHRVELRKGNNIVAMPLFLQKAVGLVKTEGGYCLHALESGRDMPESLGHKVLSPSTVFRYGGRL